MSSRNIALLGLISLAPSILAQVALAANGSGRGGDTGWVCFVPAPAGQPTNRQQLAVNDGVISPAFLLSHPISRVRSTDLLLAERVDKKIGHAHPIVQPGPDETKEHYVERLRLRLEPNIPQLAQVIKQARDIFTQAPSYDAPNGLADMNDDGASAVDDLDNCVKITLAVQDTPAEYTEINWNSMFYPIPQNSTLSQATTDLHEYFYLDARHPERFKTGWQHLDGVVDSVGTQRLVGAIIREDITLRELKQTAMQLGYVGDAKDVGAQSLNDLITPVETGFFRLLDKTLFASRGWKWENNKIVIDRAKLLAEYELAFRELREDVKLVSESELKEIDSYFRAELIPALVDATVVPEFHAPGETENCRKAKIPAAIVDGSRFGMDRQFTILLPAQKGSPFFCGQDDSAAMYRKLYHKLADPYLDRPIAAATR